jgi:hypothetical protein
LFNLKNQANNTNQLNTKSHAVKSDEQISYNELKKNSDSPTNTTSENTTSTHGNLNKFKAKNRSKGKSTVIQTATSPSSPSAINDSELTNRSMSVSPLPKKTSKSTSPKNETRAKLSPLSSIKQLFSSPPTTTSTTTTPLINSNNQNFYSSNDYSTADTTANTNDGSFLEVENEIEIKTEINTNDKANVNRQTNYSTGNNNISNQQINTKKRPLNSSESSQLLSQSNTNSLNLKNSNLKLTQQKQQQHNLDDENNAKKQKRFKSQETINNTNNSNNNSLNSSTTDSPNFLNENKLIKKNNNNINKNPSESNLKSK